RATLNRVVQSEHETEQSYNRTSPVHKLRADELMTEMRPRPSRNSMERWAAHTRQGDRVHEDQRRDRAPSTQASGEHHKRCGSLMEHSPPVPLYVCGCRR